MTNNQESTAVTMGGVPAADLATGELISRDRFAALVRYGQELGLRPELGHLCLMYGKPYVTIDGYLYHASQTNIPYSLDSHPLKGPQRTDYMIKEGAHAWIATVQRLDNNQVFTGLGVVEAEEIEAEAKGKPGVKRYPVVAAKPYQMAQKRAEWQVLRRAFPLGVDQNKQEG